MSQSSLEQTPVDLSRGTSLVGYLKVSPSPQYHCLRCRRSFDASGHKLSLLNQDAIIYGRRGSFLSRVRRAFGSFALEYVVRLNKSPGVPMWAGYLLLSIEHSLWASRPSSIEGALRCGGGCLSTSLHRSG